MYCFRYLFLYVSPLAPAYQAPAAPAYQAPKY